MPEGFEEAREFVSSMRYGGEFHRLIPQQRRISPDAIWSHLSSTGMEVSPQVIPGVAEQIRECFDRLFADTKGVRSFIYPSKDFQASCLPISENQCAILIASTLIERLTKEELLFVIGHEMGHFLLDHLNTEMPPEDSLEYYSIKRAQEISCDRIGLISCKDVDAAIRAIMKTVSGLGNKHLRFDTAHFLSSSIECMSAYHDPSKIYSSHPNMTVRARSLIWFSDYMKAYLDVYDCDSAKLAFQKMDNRVKRDMEKYVEVSTKYQIDQYKEDVICWIWLGTAITDGKLTADEQLHLSSELGTEFMDKVKDMFSGQEIDAVKSFIKNKAEYSIKELIRMSPNEGRKYIYGQLMRSEQCLLSGQSRSLVRDYINHAIGENAL